VARKQQPQKKNNLVSWFGFALDEKVCKKLGGATKDTLIYVVW